MRIGGGTRRLGAAAAVLLVAGCGDDGAGGTGEGGGSATGATSTSTGSGPATGATTTATGAGGGDPTCPPGYTDCDGDSTTICETSTDISLEHCGACDVPCEVLLDHGEAVCVEGACEQRCEPGFVDCNEDADDGCEVTSGECGLVTLAVVDAPTGLAVDDQHVWFGSRGHAPDFLDGYVARVRKDGSDEGDFEIVADGQPKPFNIAIDDEHVAWSRRDDLITNLGSVWVRRKDADPDEPSTRVADGLDQPNNPVLVGDHVWFGAGTSIRRAPIDGSAGDTTGEEIAPVGFPRDIALDGDEMFWADDGGEGGVPSVVAHRIGTDDFRELASGIGSPSFRVGISSTHLFVGSSDGATLGLWRVARDGSGAVLIDGFAAAPQEVVVDEERDRVYFTTGNGTTVLACPTDGLDCQPEIVANDQVYSSYIAADVDTLYWTAGFLDDDDGAIRARPK